MLFVSFRVFRGPLFSLTPKTIHEYIRQNKGKLGRTSQGGRKLPEGFSLNGCDDFPWLRVLLPNRELMSHHRSRCASQSPIIVNTSARIIIGGGSFA